MRYLINNHEIEFDRKAMTAAHQAFPLEFAEWNLALKLKGKALLPGVRVREIPPPYLAEGDNPKTRWPLRPGDPGYDALKKLEAVAEAAREFREHEAAIQQHRNAGELKAHVVKRLEILSDLYAALEALDA